MSRFVIGRAVAFCASLAVATSACAEPDYEPLYGWVLAEHYANGVPEAQATALADHVISASELAAAATARDECLRAIDGVVWIEDFAWVGDIDFAGGAYRVRDGIEASDVQPAADTCYFDTLALVETAWFDQEILGEWTEENLVDES
ncbi:MAG: hypothetical protein R2706_11760 [Acidimicrobiales bacterium]